MSELDMLKLWKALYFCMWLADKQEVQTELARAFAKMVDVFKTEELSLLFLRSFFIIMIREWSSLDSHRINKFYTLIRIITNKALAISWEMESKLNSIMAIFSDEVLAKKPNGKNNI
jgi:ribosomal RNA-processing protein 1